MRLDKVVVSHICAMTCESSIILLAVLVELGYTACVSFMYVLEAFPVTGGSVIGTLPNTVGLHGEANHLVVGPLIDDTYNASPTRDFHPLAHR